MTPEQEKALAIARARIKVQQDQAAAPNQQQGTGQELSTANVDNSYSNAPEWTKPFTAFGQGAVNMATLGYGDEIGAAIDAAGSHMLPWRTPKTYDQALQEGRVDQSQIAADQPTANLTGNIAGGIALGPALRTLASVPAVASATAPIVAAADTVLPAAGTIAGNVSRGSVAGTTLGGLYGFGSGEGGFVPRAENAGVNAGIGGLVGAAVPVVAAGAGAATRNVADYFADNATARQLGISRPSLDQLRTVMTADESLGPRGLTNINAAGREAMLLDAGPNARALADEAIQSQGNAGVLGNRRISDRANRSAQQLTDTLDTTLGVPQGVETAKAGIRQAAAPQLHAVYDGPNGAYAQPIDYASPQGIALENMVKNRVPGNVINEANRLIRLEGQDPSRQILARVADDGSVTYERLPDVRQIDYITRALNDVGQTENAKGGVMGGNTQVGRAHQNLSTDLRNNLRQAVPEYDTALNTAVQPIRQVQMTDLGARLLSPSTTREDVQTAVRGITAPERAAVGQGIRSNIDDQMANVQRALTDDNMDAREAVKAIKLLSSRANREKVGHAIGQAEADQLFDTVDEISHSFSVRAAVAENSKTAVRTAIREARERLNAPNAVQTLIQGHPINAYEKVAQILTRQTPAANAARTAGMQSEVVDILTRPAAQTVPNMRVLMGNQNQTLANQVRGNAVAQLLSGSRNAVYPSVALQRKEPR